MMRRRQSLRRNAESISFLWRFSRHGGSRLSEYAAGHAGQSLHHCAAVRRGAPDAFVIGDMPFMTCHASETDALKNAARYLQEAQCDAVKIEGDAALAPTVERMVHAGIPVMGHIGLLPQHIKTSGVYRVTGRKEEEAERIIADAKAMEAAGVFAMVLECMPAELGEADHGKRSAFPDPLESGLECIVPGRFRWSMTCLGFLRISSRNMRGVMPILPMKSAALSRNMFPMCGSRSSPARKIHSEKIPCGLMRMSRNGKAKD